LVISSQPLHHLSNLPSTPMTMTTRCRTLD
jgi:hypothetical protein